MRTTVARSVSRQRPRPAIRQRQRLLAEQSDTAWGRTERREAASFISGLTSDNRALNTAQYCMRAPHCTTQTQLFTFVIVTNIYSETQTQEHCIRLLNRYPPQHLGLLQSGSAIPSTYSFQ